LKRPKFRGAIWHDGIYNLPIFMLQTDALGGSADFKGLPIPWTNLEELEKWNPARPELLAEWKNAPPTLVVHSDMDYRCPITEGLATYRTLKVHGVPSRFLNFSDEGHWVLNPENSIVWHGEVFGWMKKYVGSPAPVGQ
jgi:dipeptidyl aminopeptidase/acylaminoacyl peptidase